MLQGKKAVLFDLDGTLVDSMWMWKEIDVLYLGRLGKELPPGLQRDIEGMSFTETAVYFKETFDTPESIGEIKEIWLSMARDKYLWEVPLKAGVPEFLKVLKEKGIKTGICSSNSIELVEAVLQTHGIDGCFHKIRTCCDVPHGKPAPDIYLKVAEDLQVEPEECMVFEDIPMGILAGKNAGMSTCAVEDAFSRDQEEEKRRLADYYITSYYDVINGTYEEV